ncbi:MAG: beta-hexosaminidase [Calditrichaeota bacterium]|nr:MAG: beta-hexosaminidase [Calditrichota bacterium]
MKFKKLKSSIFFWFLIMAHISTHSVAKDKKNKLDLMPMPAEMSIKKENFRLDASFKMKVVGPGHERILSAATRMLRRLSNRTGLFFEQSYLKAESAVVNPDFTINCKRAGQVKLGEDESYSLSVSAIEIYLHAENDLGAMHGLETLLQLLSTDEKGYYLPGVSITDTPRFKWRGLLIDPGRHFMPVEVIKRNLDGMAAVKMNVLHWHLTEDQGFRVESKIYPKLHELGSDGQFYSQNQIKDIIKYAEDRGIRVVPEFDVPGHCTSWLVGHPELGSAPGPYEIERGWGIKYPALNPVSDAVIEFLDDFFGEMAGLFPDPYFHIGGDEVEQGSGHKAKHWNESADIQAFMKKNNIPDNAALQAFFNKRILKVLTKHDKIMVGWEEILHESMPRNIVIQSWRGPEAMVNAARSGFQSILSKGYYIDLIKPARTHYLVDPVPENSPLSPEEKDLILGGEATMWGEFVTPETIDSRIWPRTAVIAERLWSPPEINNVDEMYRRLDIISLQLEEHGLTHEKNYDMMLRRLVRSGEITALKTFVDVVEPVKIYRRNALREHTSFSPMTRVVDTARPDAKTARIFNQMVAQFCTGESAQLAAKIRHQLDVWQKNHTDLEKSIRIAPVLQEIAPLSLSLAQCAVIGLRALSAVENGKKIKSTEIAAAKEQIEKAKEPYGQVELQIIPGIEELLGLAVD